MKKQNDYQFAQTYLKQQENTTCFVKKGVLTNSKFW